MVVAAEARKTPVITRAVDHARKPWAVSLKYTSSEWIVAHFVRSRPARYPPIAELRISMTISQMIADVAIPEAEAPVFAQGETEDSPRPAPRARRIRTRAAVTNAPAITADHETPEELASLPDGAAE
jgi:hypothetical protein